MQAFIKLIDWAAVWYFWDRDAVYNLEDFQLVQKAF